MISSAAKEAEKRVDQLIARNHFYEAAMVAEEIVIASPAYRLGKNGLGRFGIRRSHSTKSELRLRVPQVFMAQLH